MNYSHPAPTHDHPEKHRAENRSRLTAISTAVLVHVLVIALLAWILVGGMKPEPPELEITPAAQGDDPFKPKAEVFTNHSRRKPSQGGHSFDILTAVSVAPVAVLTFEAPMSDSVGTGLGDHFGGGGEGLGPGGGPPWIKPEFRGRCNQADRAKRLRDNGGTRALDLKVVRALEWLASQQSADGSWGQSYPVAMTGFALLAYCGHCETADSVKHGETVIKAINYLVDHASKNDGLLSSGNRAHAPYEHGIATYALAEAYSLNKNARAKFKRISPALRNAVPIIIEGQTKGGGWLYSYGLSGTGDLSISGWNIQALKAAKLTGIKFTGLDRVMKRALGYIETASTPDGLYLYRIRDGQQGRLSLTGVGVLSARILGRAMPNEDKSFAAILALPQKGFRASDPYALYYHSQACFQKGGKIWEKYNRTQQKMVIDAQEKDGSWPAASGHLGAAGNDAKIYHTCLSTLMLEVYYRYLPATNGQL